MEHRFVRMQIGAKSDDEAGIHFGVVRKKYMYGQNIIISLSEH